MFRSISWADLTESQRQCLVELGFGPGDRIYIRKLRRLSDNTLAEEHQRHLDQAVDGHRIVRSLAHKFDRNHKTIARRLRNLASISTNGDVA